MSKRTVTTLVALSLVWSAPLFAAPPAGEHAAPARVKLPGKPTGPIAVEYHVAGTPAVGVPLEIDVSARVEAEVQGLSIEANASAPQAVLVTPPAVVTAGDDVYSWRITVVPLAVEAGYLSIIVAGRVDGLAQSRGVTVSLRSAADRGPVPAAKGAGPEALIALPVQETP
jgi:hypothetical protein